MYWGCLLPTNFQESIRGLTPPAVVEACRNPAWALITSPSRTFLNAIVAR
jgi:hypothetical protein